jgi:hypothetical protein
MLTFTTLIDVQGAPSAQRNWAVARFPLTIDPYQFCRKYCESLNRGSEWLYLDGYIRELDTVSRIVSPIRPVLVDI